MVIFTACGQKEQTPLGDLSTNQAGSVVCAGITQIEGVPDRVNLRSEKPQIVAMHTDCSSWTEEMWEEAFLILDMVKFDESRTE